MLSNSASQMPVSIDTHLQLSPSAERRYIEDVCSRRFGRLETVNGLARLDWAMLMIIADNPMTETFMYICDEAGMENCVVWDVDMAKKIMPPTRQTGDYPYLRGSADMSTAQERIISGHLAVDWGKAQGIGKWSDEPIICVPFGRAMIVIDGLHRLAWGVIYNKRTYKYICLTPEKAMECTIFSMGQYIVDGWDVETSIAVL